MTRDLAAITSGALLAIVLSTLIYLFTAAPDAPPTANSHPSPEPRVAERSNHG